MRPRLCVALHDVSPHTWPACERVIRAVRKVAEVPLTLLLVPAYHGDTTPLPRAFREAIYAHQDRGDELTLHGFTHLEYPRAPMAPWAWLRRRVYTAGEGEFSALSQSQARARLEAGLQWCERYQFNVRGFVAPAWLLSTGARAALRTFSFAYTTQLHHVIDLAQDTRHWAPSVVYSHRAAWRRKASCAWNAAWAHRLSSASVVRLGLHPGDADYPALREHWQTLLDALLRERAASTKLEAFQELFTVDAGTGKVHSRAPVPSSDAIAP